MNIYVDTWPANARAFSRPAPKPGKKAGDEVARVLVLCREQSVGELDDACQIALITPISLRKRHFIFSNNLNKMEEGTL